MPISGCPIEARPEMRRLKAIARSRAWYRANREKAISRNMEYRKTEKGKEVRRTERANARKKPDWLEKNRLKESKRREAIRHQTIITSDEEWNTFAMEEMSELAKVRTSETNITWHRDHIIPIQGDTVSGFHVWYNMQVIPAEINYLKANKYKEDLCQV